MCDRPICQDGQVRPRYSVVVPVCNEEAALPELHRRLTLVMESLGDGYEVVFIDDGSSDGSFSLLVEIARRDPAVVVIKLSRNFGHQIALTAGLDYARGEAVITMDADLQHPPELIPRLVGEWQQGYQVVYGVRTFTEAEGLLKRWTSRTFYALLQRLSDTEISPAAPDFRLLDRAAVDTLRTVRERNRFLRGLVGWVGYRQKAVPFTEAARYGGVAKYSWRAMFRLAVDAIVSFSTVPLRLVTYLGLLVSLLSFVYAVYVLWARLFTDRAVPGWASITVALLTLAGAQLIGLGIIGEYIGRIYEESKQRPLYVIERVVRSETVTSSGPPPG